MAGKIEVAETARVGREKGAAAAADTARAEETAAVATAQVVKAMAVEAAAVQALAMAPEEFLAGMVEVVEVMATAVAEWRGSTRRPDQ